MPCTNYYFSKQWFRCPSLYDRQQPSVPSLAFILQFIIMHSQAWSSERRMLLSRLTIITTLEHSASAQEWVLRRFVFYYSYHRCIFEAQPIYVIFAGGEGLSLKTIS